MTGIPILPTIIADGEATGILPTRNSKGKPIAVIASDAIRQTFDQKCLEQALNAREAPGVTDLVLNPDAHCGYGAPVGCVLVSPTHIYPGPVGVDIKCSMSLLQLDLPVEETVVLRQHITTGILNHLRAPSAVVAHSGKNHSNTHGAGIFGGAFESDVRTGTIAEDPRSVI